LQVSTETACRVHSEASSERCVPCGVPTVVRLTRRMHRRYHVHVNKNTRCACGLLRQCFRPYVSVAPLHCFEACLRKSSLQLTPHHPIADTRCVGCSNCWCSLCSVSTPRGDLLCARVRDNDTGCSCVVRVSANRYLPICMMSFRESALVTLSTL
jgi:hypothetical protein